MRSEVIASENSSSSDDSENDDSEEISSEIRQCYRKMTRTIIDEYVSQFKELLMPST